MCDSAKNPALRSGTVENRTGTHSSSTTATNSTGSSVIDHDVNKATAVGVKIEISTV
jgi:hypothetical protein